MTRKRVLLIHTGGTLGMGEPAHRRLDLEPAEHLQRMLERVPELSEIADCDLIAPWNLDSSDVGPSHWQQLAQAVVQHGGAGQPGGYAGIVIIHGTDTLAYAASALAFMLRNLDRPVIFTGSQRPLQAWRTDARANLAAAVEAATLDLPEVAIVFGDRVLRGCRATKVDASDYLAFDTPNLSPLGRIGVGIDLDPVLIRRPSGPFALAEDLNRQVLGVTVFPGFDPALLDGVADSGAGMRVKALIVRAFGAGNVPIVGDYSLLPAIERMSARGVAVLIATQCLRGSAQLDLYAAGRALRDAGAISAGDMSFEAASTKAMWALGHPERSVAEWFALNLAGEVSL